MAVSIGLIIVTIVIFICAAVLVWAVERYLPIAQPFKGVVVFLIVVVAVLIVLWQWGILAAQTLAAGLL